MTLFLYRVGKKFVGPGGGERRMSKTPRLLPLLGEIAKKHCFFDEKRAKDGPRKVGRKVIRKTGNHHKGLTKKVLSLLTDSILPLFTTISGAHGHTLQTLSLRRKVQSDRNPSLEMAR